MVEEKMKAKLKMRRKTLVSALMVLLIVSIIPVLAEEGEVDLTVTVVTYIEEVPANTPTTIDASEEAGVVLEDFTSTEQATVTISLYEDNPHPEAEVPLESPMALGIYLDIETTAIDFTTTIKVYYTNEEVEAAGIKEDTLRLYYFDGTGWGQCEETGVNTEENYIWATVTHFTAFASFGTPPNEKPVADAGPDQTAYVDEIVYFNGGESYDPDGEIVLYEWNFGDGTTGTGERPSHTYSATGTVTVILTVTDNDGLTDSDDTTVKVTRRSIYVGRANTKPVADAGPNQTAWTNMTVYFNGSKSKDPDGTIESYVWDFGDGTTASGVAVEHEYSESGQYAVTLTVRDNRRAYGSDTCNVKVSDPPAPVSNQFVERVHNRTQHVVDALNETNTIVILNMTDSVTVTVLRYEDNPYPGDLIPVHAIPTYIDVEISDPDAVIWPIYVEMHYHRWEVEMIDESSLGIYYWFNGTWQRCSNTGVDTENNIVWAYMTAEEAVGSPILMGGMPAIIVPPVPPYLDNLNITPAVIELGDSVTISFDIRNMDSQSITYMVDMQVGLLIFPVVVELDAYESKTMSRTIFLSAVGIYNVTVVGMTGSFMVEAPEPPPRPAEFVVSDLTITREPLDPRTWTYEIGANVTNIGELEGTHTVAFKLDGLEVDWKTVELGGGESTIIAYDVMSGVGSWPIEVDGLTGILEVESIPGPMFEFSDLRIFYPGVIPPKVKRGKTVTVTVSVDAKNVGELVGSHTVELKVNGSVVDSQEITLEGGASVVVLFELTRGEGTYEVEVEGMTESFTVFTRPVQFWERPEFIVLGIFIAIIIGGAAYIYFKKVDLSGWY